jgi:uncharacterized protein YdaU (DUF1376 family)
MPKKPLYIQLEPGAYPKDTDWLMMTAEERGCYHSLIIFLACSNGTLPDVTGSLATLCNINSKKMKAFLEKFESKFVKKNGELSHKRVTAEIKRAKKRLQVASTSGLKGAKKRWGGHSDPIGDPIKKPIAKVSKVKESKGKGREGNIKPKNPLSFNSVPESSFKKLFSDELDPATQFEINTLNKYATECHHKQDDLPNVYTYLINEIVDLKEHCKVKRKGHDDLMRMFIASLKKEFNIV